MVVGSRFSGEKCSPEKFLNEADTTFEFVWLGGDA